MNLNYYKLIKTYPGSPELGDIWPEGTLLRGLTAISDRRLVGDGSSREIDDRIEDYPEYWKSIGNKVQYLKFKD